MDRISRGLKFNPAMTGIIYFAIPNIGLILSSASNSNSRLSNVDWMYNVHCVFVILYCIYWPIHNRPFLLCFLCIVFLYADKMMVRSRDEKTGSVTILPTTSLEGRRFIFVILLLLPLLFIIFLTYNRWIVFYYTWVIKMRASKHSLTTSKNVGRFS